VLLVDDYELLLKQWGREFAREGVSVSNASCVADAIAAVERERPDLALVDLFLSPPETGLQVIEALKAVDPSIVCILVSAHLSVAHAMMGVRAGADDVYFKPFSARQAIQRVEMGVFAQPEQTTPTLDQVEWEHISRALQDYNGNISQAADALGVFRQSLQRKIQKHAPRALRNGPVGRRQRARPGATRRKQDP
jgi:two-component system response regulator RegA